MIPKVKIRASADFPRQDMKKLCDKLGNIYDVLEHGYAIYVSERCTQEGASRPKILTLW